MIRDYFERSGRSDVYAMAVAVESDVGSELNSTSFIVKGIKKNRLEDTTVPKSLRHTESTDDVAKVFFSDSFIVDILENTEGTDS